MTVKREMKALPEHLCASTDGDVIVVLDTTVDAALRARATARELINRFQKLRKRAGLQPSDSVDLFYAAAATPPNGAAPGPAPAPPKNGAVAPTNGAVTGVAAVQEELEGAVEAEMETLVAALGVRPVAAAVRPLGAVLLAREASSLVLPSGETTGVEVSLAVPAPAVDRRAVAAEFGENSVAGVAAFVAAKGLGALRRACEGGGGKVGVVIDGHKRELVLGKHLFWSASELPR